MVPLTLFVKHTHRERELQLAYAAIDAEFSETSGAPAKVVPGKTSAANKNPAVASPIATADQIREYNEVGRLVMADLQKGIEDAQRTGGSVKTSLSAAELKRVQAVVASPRSGQFEYAHALYYRSTLWLSSFY